MVLVDRVSGRERGEELLVVGIPVQEALEPAALGRDVVEHAVVHQPEAQAELFEILPGTQSRVDLLEVDDGKAAVGGVGEEREDMHGVDGAPHEYPQEIRKRLEGLLPGAGQEVPVRDEDDVSLAE